VSKRSKEADGDSLELLLDPVCCLFGTIMFVMLIAAVIAMTRTSVAQDPRPSEAPVGGAMAEVVREEIAALEARLASIPIPEVDQELALAEGNLEQLLAELAGRREFLKDLQEAADKLEGKLDNIDGAMSDIDRHIERLKARLAAARAQTSRKARTPYLHDIRQDPFSVVVWQDRMYFVCRPIPEGRLREFASPKFLFAWHPRHVSAGASHDISSSGVVTRRARLNAAAGIPLTSIDEVLRHSDVQEVITTLEASTWFISITVCPDSFDSWHLVKELFLNKGFEYSTLIEASPLPAFDDQWFPGTPQGF
jgi:hypothetical protein